MKNEFNIQKLIGCVVGFVLVCIALNINLSDILTIAKGTWYWTQTIITTLVNGFCIIVKTIF